MASDLISCHFSPFFGSSDPPPLSKRDKTNELIFSFVVTPNVIHVLKDNHESLQSIWLTNLGCNLFERASGFFFCYGDLHNFCAKCMCILYHSNVQVFNLYFQED